jgi:hypothetical protein
MFIFNTNGFQFIPTLPGMLMAIVSFAIRHVDGKASYSWHLLKLIPP